jgi:uncharacterized protein (TIGR01777 family)
LISWNPERGVLDAPALEGHDAIVHLAGESIFGRWTQARKAHIRDSRVRGTALLARTIAGLQRPPSVLVSASAIGYYGNRPQDEQVEENASNGSGFLASVCSAWEEAAEPAKTAGTRVVHPRFGIVLSPKGGALAVMLPIFKAGLGGKLGSGSQMWSWITINDVIGGIRHTITRTELRGAVNFTAPSPVPNATFTKTLGHVLGRPTWFAVPSVAMKLVMGEMAEDMLLSGARVVPRKLLDSGYNYRQSELEPALRDLLKNR